MDLLRTSTTSDIPPAVRREVLVVEDSPSDAALVQAMIADSSSGRFVCTVETSLKDALASLARSPSTECVLLDLGLPDSQGIETLDAIIAAAPNSAVIVLTGRAEEALGQLAIHHGAQDFLSKNAIDPRSLRRAMRYAIERKSAAEVTRQLLRRQSLVAELGLEALNSEVSVLEKAAQLVVSELGTKVCAVMEVGGAAADTLKFRARVGWPESLPLAVEVPIEAGESLGYAIRSRIPVQFANAATETRFYLAPEVVATGAMSGLVLVVLRNQDAWGLLATFDTEPRDFSEADQSFFQQVVNVVAAAVQQENVLAEMAAAIEMKTRFIENVSHELRTPMNGVLGLADSFARDESDPAKRLHALTLWESANHLMEIIDEVTDFAALNGGKVSVEVVDFDLNATVERVVGVASRLAAAKNLRVTLDVSPRASRWVRGDRRHIRRVLAELLDNAVKFTNTGYIALRIAPTTGDRVRFEVVDTGVGVGDQATDIFAAFDREDTSSTRRVGGLGLGLAICSRLAELMGATLGVDSKPGRGSTFSFELPLPSVHGEQRTVGVSSPAMRVLVVDDINVNRLVARRVLERLGHRVDDAPGGAEAVAAVEATRYDVVFMDLLMPEMDGYTATAQIRALSGPAAATPIIAVTALSDSRERCMKAGMNGFVTKPVNRDVMHAALQRTLAPASTPDPSEPQPTRYDAAWGAVDPRLLTELRGLSGTEGDALVRSVIDAYRTEAALQLATMEHLAAAGDDVQALRRAGHALKGMSAQVGATRLPALCSGLGDIEPCLWPARVEQIQREHEALLESLAALDQEFAA
ncbi:MAG: response regulator [Acidimicrobiales bacterium]|nr:response regulator [Acidimicrobiales bacterium]